MSETMTLIELNKVIKEWAISEGGSSDETLDLSPRKICASGKGQKAKTKEERAERYRETLQLIQTFEILFKLVIL